MFLYIWAVHTIGLVFLFHEFQVDTYSTQHETLLMEKIIKSDKITSLSKPYALNVNENG